MAEKIYAKCVNINPIWLLTGEGNPPKDAELGERQNKLIPYYDDISTIGGAKESGADMHGISAPADYIDTGDRNRDATAAVRHYGDSMAEYPNGCILAPREVRDRSLIVPGRDYVIETSEYRVTKRIQSGHDDKHFTAYSTNEEKYADGRLIHEPFEVRKESIDRIFLVLGYVVKKNGGTLVYSNSKK